MDKENKEIVLGCLSNLIEQASKINRQYVTYLDLNINTPTKLDQYYNLKSEIASLQDYVDCVTESFDKL